MIQAMNARNVIQTTSNDQCNRATRALPPYPREREAKVGPNFGGKVLHLSDKRYGNAGAPVFLRGAPAPRASGHGMKPTCLSTHPGTCSGARRQRRRARNLWLQCRSGRWRPKKVLIPSSRIVFINSSSAAWSLGNNSSHTVASMVVTIGAVVTLLIGIWIVHTIRRAAE
jgi:hypothetical protein